MYQLYFYLFIIIAFIHTCWIFNNNKKIIGNSKDIFILAFALGLSIGIACSFEY